MVIFTKRRKFILSSFLLSAGMISLHFGLSPNRYISIAALSILCIPLTLWSLKEALKGPIWFLSWILPLLFTAGVGFFYFLLPTSLYTAIPVILIYLLGMYVLFLSENIFAVTAIRTIQLYRSSMAVSFLLSLVIAFLLFDSILSFRFPFYLDALLIFLNSFLIFLHGFWSVNFEERINGRLLLYSSILALGLSEISIGISFWPAGVTLSSVFLTSIVYVFLGLGQANLNDRLFKSTIKEYAGVAIAVFFILLYYTTWG